MFCEPEGTKTILSAKGDSNLKRINSGSYLPKKVGFICFNRMPFQMMKNTFNFMLKALFNLKIFKFLSLLFWSWRKTAC